MKNTLKTFPYIHGQAVDCADAKNKWKEDFEKELTEEVITIEAEHDEVGTKVTMLRFHTLLMKILLGDDYLTKKEVKE